MKSKNNYINREDMARVFEAVGRINFAEHDPEDVRMIFKTTYWCALRIDETLHVRWDDIDWDAGLLTLRKTKTEKNVPALMPPRFVEELDAYYQKKGPARDDVLIWPGVKYINVYKWLRRIGEITGLEALKAGQEETGEKTIAHIFRKSMAKEMVMGGFGKKADLATVARKLRHDNLATTSKYLKVGVEAEREFWG